MSHFVELDMNLVDGKRMLIPHEPEARIIRLVFQWYTQGDGDGRRLSMQGIAEKLTEMDVPTWSDLRGATVKKARGYGEWGRGLCPISCIARHTKGSGAMVEAEVVVSAMTGCRWRSLHWSMRRPGRRHRRRPSEI